MRIAMTALALALVAGSSAQAADVVLASSASGVTVGSDPSTSNHIRAYSGGDTFLPNQPGNVNIYGFNTAMSMFRTFDNTLPDATNPFKLAQSAPAANILQSPIPGAWNNGARTSPVVSPGNVVGGFTPTPSISSTYAGAARLNASSAQWIHNSAQAGNNGQSVLFAVPFTATTSRVDITLSFLTDNGFGNRNRRDANGNPVEGPNNRLTPAGYENDGVFMNGTSLGYSSPGGSGQPAQFGNITTLTFTNITTTVGQNWLYLYQFNWGGPGGSAFTAEINMVPTPVGAGLSAAGMLLLAARRRRA